MNTTNYIDPCAIHRDQKAAQLNHSSVIQRERERQTDRQTDRDRERERERERNKINEVTYALIFSIISITDLALQMNL